MGPDLFSTVDLRSIVKDAAKSLSRVSHKTALADEARRVPRKLEIHLWRALIAAEEARKVSRRSDELQEPNGQSLSRRGLEPARQQKSVEILRGFGNAQTRIFLPLLPGFVTALSRALSVI